MSAAGPRKRNHSSPRISLAVALAITLACAAALAGCERKRPAPVAAPPETVAALPPLRYHRHPVGEAAALRAFQRELGEERFALVLGINRLDLAHVRDRDSLVVPDDFRAAAAYSPFPDAIPAADSLPKLLLVSLRVQAFGAYESGRQVRWGPTSSGRRQMPTPPGLYHANWKAKERRSTVNDEWILKWCVNIENGGISLHEYELPGYPASHSCVRLLEADARWLYAWAEQWAVSEDGRSVLKPGTPVVIFGEYAFGRRAPWKRLPEDAQATDVALAEAEEALRGYLFPPAPDAAPDTAQAAAP